MTDKHDNEVLDAIRCGATLKNYRENHESYRRAKISDDFLNELKSTLEQFESGKLIIQCTKEDKKRIIKEEIHNYIQDGMTHKEAENQIRIDLKEGLLKFIK